MKILVTGGRDYTDKLSVDWALDQIEEYLLERNQKVHCVIHGDATGADTLADKWAGDNGYLQVRCPGNHDKFGNAFGPIRNKQMLILQPDIIVAFPGGNGTKNMKELARRYGYKVWEPMDCGLSIWDFMKPYTVFDEGY